MDKESSGRAKDAFLVKLIRSLATEANGSDIDQKFLQDALFEARRLDSKIRGWNQERLILSTGYADTRSLKYRLKVIAERIQVKSVDAVSCPDTLIRKVLEPTNKGLLDKLITVFGNADVTVGAIVRKLATEPRLAKALIRDALEEGLLKMKKRAVYMVHHQGVILRNMRADSKKEPLGGGSSDMI